MNPIVLSGGGVQREKTKISQIEKMPTKDNKQVFVDRLLSKMSIEQKVGQCLVLGFSGNVVTPETIRKIHEYQPAGFACGTKWRIRTCLHDPDGTNPEYAATRMLRVLNGTNRDYLPGLPVPHCTNSEFCEILNGLKAASLENNTKIPVAITYDDEGDQSAEYFWGGYHFVPSWLGIASTGKPEFAYDATWAIARQILPLGYDWSYSLCIDVNTNPMNPEIGTRSFGPDTELVSKLGTLALNGYRDGGLICSGKHFPGRGECDVDAHRTLPVINETKKVLLEKHVAPYRALIEAGVPSVMTAHTKYPALDPSGKPASLSKIITTDLLKKELGFEGVVITDEITMGGIIAEYDVHEACILALEAGADQILFRDEGGVIDESFTAMVDSVEKGRISESRLDDAVRRTLSVKYDYGFFNSSNNLRDETKASEGIDDPKVETISVVTAKSSIKVLRDEANLLPVSKETKVLLIEQVNPLHALTNTLQCHPGLLWEKCLEFSENVGFVETTMHYTPEDRERVNLRKDQADLIIITNYYNRRVGFGDSFVEDVHKWGKPVIVVTNSPYPLTVRPEYKTVIVNYSSAPAAYAEVAKKIFAGGK
jgi:beta-N-acetylhexosaminidase